MARHTQLHEALADITETDFAVTAIARLMRDLLGKVSQERAGPVFVPDEFQSHLHGPQQFFVKYRLERAGAAILAAGCQVFLVDFFTKCAAEMEAAGLQGLSIEIFKQVRRQLDEEYRPPTSSVQNIGKHFRKNV